MVTLDGSLGFGRRVASDVAEKNVTFLAAALAYHAFLSLVPMLVLLLLVLTTVGSGLEARIVASAQTWLPGPIADIVTQSFADDPDGTGVSILGLVVLLWGTLKIFRGLDTAFAAIYETDGSTSLLGKFRDGIVVAVALGVALVAMVGASVLLGGLFGAVPYSGVVTPLALLAGLVVAFYPIYYVFPDVDVGVRDVFPGVVVAAVGWGALQGFFQLYLSVTEPSAGSVFGGVVVVVTYLYFSALVLLVGAVVNAVVGSHSAGVPAGRNPASGVDTERRERLARPELAAYLRDLRARLVGDDDTGERPLPSGDVELVERSAPADGHDEWTVTLRWTYEDRQSTPEAAADGGTSPEQVDG